MLQIELEEVSAGQQAWANQDCKPILCIETNKFVMPRSGGIKLKLWEI